MPRVWGHSFNHQMAFHYHSTEEARAAIYDAAMLLLQADAKVALPINIQTIKELGEICWRIEHGEKLSKSPLLPL